MVFLRDEGSEFDAPLDTVWEFVGSGDRHSEAHRHRRVTRTRPSDRTGTYAWEQEFDGARVRFAMRWTSFWPLGLAYDVLAGPFTGSRFFLYYEPRGPRTAVGIVGEFRSPQFAESDLPAAVDRFFASEFDQDATAIRTLAGRRDPATSGGGPRPKATPRTAGRSVRRARRRRSKGPRPRPVPRP